MAIRTINLDVADITCFRFGENIAIELEDGMIIAFTTEAIEELIDDYEYILSTERAEQVAEEERNVRENTKSKYTTEELIHAIAEQKAIRELKNDLQNASQELFEQAFNSPHAFYVQSGDCLCEVHNVTGKESPSERYSRITEQLKW